MAAWLRLRLPSQCRISGLSTRSGASDCGCGTGSITLGIAERVAPRQVVGIDLMDLARAPAADLAERPDRMLTCSNSAFQNALLEEVSWNASA